MGKSDKLSPDSCRRFANFTVSIFGFCDRREQQVLPFSSSTSSPLLYVHIVSKFTPKYVYSSQASIKHFTVQHSNSAFLRIHFSFSLFFFSLCSCILCDIYFRSSLSLPVILCSSANCKTNLRLSLRLS